MAHSVRGISDETPRRYIVRQTTWQNDAPSVVQINARDVDGIGPGMGARASVGPATGPKFSIDLAGIVSNSDDAHGPMRLGIGL